MHRVLPKSVNAGRSRPLRAVGSFAVRSLTSVAFAVWFGGFTFYAAVVVPDLHEALGGLETGEISRRVSFVLNAIGVAAVALGWLRVAGDREGRDGWRGWTRIGLLAATTAFLLALIALHRHLGARLDAGGSLAAFRPVHEFYLILSTAQWAANLGLLAIEARSPRPRDEGAPIVDRGFER